MEKYINTIDGIKEVIDNHLEKSKIYWKTIKVDQPTMCYNQRSFSIYITFGLFFRNKFFSHTESFLIPHDAKGIKESEIIQSLNNLPEIFRKEADKYFLDK